jgi:hypothetical protein
MFLWFGSDNLQIYIWISWKMAAIWKLCELACCWSYNLQCGPLLTFKKITSAGLRANHEAILMCVNFMCLVQRRHLRWQLTSQRGDSIDVKFASLLQQQLIEGHFSSVAMNDVQPTSSSINTTDLMGEGKLLALNSPSLFLIFTLVLQDGR